LTQIAVLEESYKDHYQHLWEFGMDALTFMLDAVAPVWRTYGKRIGEDVRDFLIVPWYRNEFTGEARRYALPALPRRSARHWLALALLAAGAGALAGAQARLLATSAGYYALPGVRHPGLWWALLPLFWLGMLVQACLLALTALVISAWTAVAVWWLGWMLGVVS
jgi:hypothetical protein